jgi:hypothetical protein
LQLLQFFYSSNDMKTRRQFLLNCSTLALAASALPTGLWAASPRSAAAGGFESFHAQVGSVFRVENASGASVRLKLVEARQTVSRHPQAHLAPDAQNEKFALLFRGVAGGELTQDTYEFSHSELGGFLMFIVPVKVAGSEHFHYEAIFNRPRTENLV